MTPDEVRLKTPLSFESHVALRALEGLSVAMDHHVDLEVATGAAHLATHWTLVLST